MNLQGRIPRSRGLVCGVLLILLGLWGGLAPFIGPYFHLGFAPDVTWKYNTARLYYSVIPGAAALLGGLMVVATRNRAVGVIGGLLAALGGVWFIGGVDFVSVVLKLHVPLGTPLLPSSALGSVALRTYLDSVALLVGVGVLVLFLGSLAMGRFSMVSAQDIEAEASEYYPGTPPAGSTEAVDYPTPTGQFDTTASRYPSS